MVSSGIASSVTQTGYSMCALCVGWVHPPLTVEPWLLLADEWEGFTLTSQSAARIGCDHWPPTSAIWGSAVQGQGGGALTWSVAVHWVCWSSGFPSGAGQVQPPPVFWLGLPFLSYKAIWDGCYLWVAWRFPIECPSCETMLAAAGAGPGAHWGQLWLVS